jgi:hypothetical protein
MLKAMEMAYPEPHSGDLQVRHVMRDGNLVAVLMAIESGETCTVVTEVFGQNGDDRTTPRRRPYTFSSTDSARAFIAEALTAFTYLGCEVRNAA